MTAVHGNLVPPGVEAEIDTLLDLGALAAHMLIQDTGSQLRSAQGKALLEQVQLVASMRGFELPDAPCAVCGTTDPYTSPTHKAHLEES